MRSKPVCHWLIGLSCPERCGLHGFLYHAWLSPSRKSDAPPVNLGNTLYGVSAVSVLQFPP
jgi:hypothetical protein